MSGHVIETVHLIIEWAALGIEILAVAVIVGGVVVLGVKRGTMRYLFDRTNQTLTRATNTTWGKRCYWDWSCWSRRMWCEP